MARLPRLYAPGIPQLVQANFARPLATAADPTPADALDQIHDWLRAGIHEHKPAVHAWAILNDRLLLLATPPGELAISRLIQGLGRRMAGLLGGGPVFAGRYRSTLVEPGRWVLPAQVWMEWLPAQLHYVDTPSGWPWSSAAQHAGIPANKPSLLTDHPDYWACGNTPFAREATYKHYLLQGLTQATTRKIEASLRGQWALGDDTFIASLESRSSRRAAPAKRGRPRKSPPPSTTA
jgi:putative transposase